MTLDSLMLVCGVVLIGMAATTAFAAPAATAAETQTLYLSGKGTDDAVPWKFQVTGGRRAGEAATMPVPGCWELHGFGAYNYGHDTKKADEKGLYERSFDVPAAWQGRRVRLVFDGVMTDADVQVNGKSAGPVHQGAFYRFKYDVTDLVRFGAANTVAVAVSKMSANAGVNRAERQGDFWVFGGIIRPVWLEAVPAQFIERTALDARADGSFAIDVFLGGAGKADAVSAQIVDAEGKPVGAAFAAPVAAGADKVTLKTRAAGPRLWTAETPSLYTVRLALKQGATDVHATTQRFGFRTFEVRDGDGLYLNGKKIRVKGCDRHSFHPDTGRATWPGLSVADVRLMKEMNMNAVRMSHYPPDEHFLDTCDELGLYVLDELAGWQKAYDTEVGAKLVEEMVKRDVNHPSILFWDNGNEGGWNRDLDSLFAQWDPQARRVLHPWENFDGVNTAHYRTYKLMGEILAGKDIHMTTEFLHGLYDGGHGAGLEDYWTVMMASPLAAGGFLWALVDECVKRTDKGDILDGDGNHAPDGITGPRREKEGSFFTIKAIWSPIYIPMKELPADFAGAVPVENRYDFTDLAACTLGWELLKFRGPADAEVGHAVVHKGDLSKTKMQIAPGEKATIHLTLPPTWKQADALRLSATDPTGRLIRTWTWPIRKAADYAKAIVPASTTKATGAQDGAAIKVTAGAAELVFSKADGRLESVKAGGKAYAFSGGPTFAAGTQDPPSEMKKDVEARKAAGLKPTPKLTTVAAPKPRAVTAKADGNDFVVRAEYDGALKFLEWRIAGSGWARLEYAYDLAGDYDWFGVSFDCPEAKVKGVRWLGGGPYRVWKNRMAGPELDVWQKPYNDTATGASWEYPEFKGYHAPWVWAVLETADGPITMVAGQDDLFLRLFTPRMLDDARFTRVGFPSGDVSVLHAIAPTGSKFHKASDSGPMGKRTTASGTYKGVVYFFFGPVKP